MTKRLRMLVALFTALSMLFAFSLSAAAATFPDIDEDSDIHDSAELLAELNIYEGYPDGSFGEDNTITRAEFAAIVTRALNRSSVAESLADLPTGYSDDGSIDSWARGYINYATNQGIIEGYPDGTFEPQGNVTFAEAYAMLARTMGVDKAATGSWPANYIGLAAELGLDAGLSGSANVPITRGEMAVATENALFADYKWDSDEEELVRSDKEDGAESLIVRRHDWKLSDWSDHADADRTVTGEFRSYLSSSKRVDVDGTRYDLHEDFVVADNLLLNGVAVKNLPGSVAFSGWSDVEKQDDQIKITLNKDNEVTKAEVLRDDIIGLLTDVDVDSNETEYGSIEVDGDELDVNADTKILVDGEEITLADLEELDLVDEAAVTVRSRGTLGDVALRVVVNADTITGEVIGFGEDDDDGKFVVIEDANDDEIEVFYAGSFDAEAEVDEGDNVTLILNASGKAVGVLELDEAQREYHAILRTKLSGDRVRVEAADGTRSSYDLSVVTGAGASHAYADLDVGSVYEVTIKGGKAELRDATLSPAADLERVVSTYIRVDGDAVPIADDVIVEIAGKFEKMSDLTTGEDVRYATNGAGLVDYIVQDDFTAPLLTSAAVTGTTLTLTYDETLDGTSVPAVGAFSVENDTAGNGTFAANVVTNVAVTGSTVVLTITTAPGTDDVVRITYTAGADPIQDGNSNEAADLTNESVTNNN